MSRFEDHYAQVFRYVLTEHIRPGRGAAWRASLLLGCIYGLSVVIGLSILSYGLRVEVSSFEIMLGAWLVTGLTAAATYFRFGKMTSVGAVENFASRHPLSLSLVLFLLSSIVITGAAVAAAYFVRAN